MSKILDNTTGAPIAITDTGITVDNVTNYTIPPQDYLIWAASDNVITEIGSGNIVVNDGTSDLSINDGTKLIQGIFPNPLSTSELSASPGAHSFTNKYRSIFNGAGMALTTSLQTVYTYSGSGKFIGFILDFSSGNIDIEVKVTIDSEVVFDLNSSDVLDAQVGTGINVDGTFGGPVFDNTGKKFSFQSPLPILYDTTILIEARRVSGTPDLSRYIVNLTKET